MYLFLKKFCQQFYIFYENRFQKDSTDFEIDKVLIIHEDIGRFLSGSRKKFSTFEFLENRTILLTENSAEKPVQLASTFSLFFSAALKLLLGFS